jgi:endonuclease YncB( thermonuclease family)
LIGHKISTASKLDKVQHRITISILVSIIISLYLAVEWLELFYYPNSIISKDVRVIDGDTLILANKRIRLRGIDSPEIKQKCSGKYYRCGEIAKKELIDIIGNSEVKCSLGKTDKYKRILSYCAVKNNSLNYELIRLGLARIYINTNLLLRLAEFKSRFNKVGIWSVGFYAPSDWRHKKLRQKNKILS